MFRIFYIVAVVLFLGSECVLLANFRESSEPFLSGDTFRARSDYVFDETSNQVDPQMITFGNTIFVKTDLLPVFFEKIHPDIACPYVLFTHNSDLPIPGNYGHMLDDEKILAWFGINVENFSHPKLHPVPIGLANRRWLHGDIRKFIQVHYEFCGKEKKYLLYMNFIARTNNSIRAPIYEQFISEPYCFFASGRNLREYLVDLSRSLFVLSPRGNGLDCHRTWEALYMGAFPIVQSSSLDSMYDGLPVVIVEDWREITPDFLEKKLEKIEQLSNWSEKLWVDYWLEKINAYKKIIE